MKDRASSHRIGLKSSHLATAMRSGEMVPLARAILEMAGPLCLATEDRGLVAAAILARLCGGPELILPPGLGTNMLEHLARQLPGLRLLHTRPHPIDAPIRLCPGWQERELLRIFTGGTTGRPAIWPKTGLNLLAEARYLCQRFAIGPRDTILATVPPCHIYGLLFSVLIPLVSGAGVIPEKPLFPAEIREAARQHRATVLVSVPPHYQALRDTPLDCADLRLAFSSAGPLGKTENRDFRHRNQVAVIEIFGSTETGGIASRNRQAGEQGFTPFAPVQWRIHDDLLLVRSPFLSPTLELDDEGWFHSTDRVTRLSGDAFLPRGRADNIAKVGGKRVDLDEVAQTIRKMAGVRDCAVVALPERGGRGSRIAALVAGEAEPDQVRRELARLESHARPRTIRVVSTLPVRANGKHDRAAILELLHDRA